VTFVDVPGFLPGTEQEYHGIIRHGAKLAICLRRSDRPEGHRGDAQGLWRRLYRHVEQAFARRRKPCLPYREIAVMGPEGAINIVFREALQKATDPSKPEEQIVQLPRDVRQSIQSCRAGYIDAIIYPEDTRPTLIRSLEMLKNKQDHNPPKKHGNIPL
jgi:propionyl-CoA carboxylase beta chain